MAQRALITGGASGIGRAMAEAFSAQGARVWIVDADGAALDTCPAEWHQERFDVTEEASVAALFDRLRSEWGGLDALCANAGIAGPAALVEDVRLDEWRRCVSVNLEGAFLFAKYAARIMKAQRSGAILLTSSTAGMYGHPNRAPYCAAKWGVIGLMKTLTMELGPLGVRCNAICPGPVEGPRMERVLELEAKVKGTTRDHLYEGYAAGTSMRQWVTAADVANMAVFLASDSAPRVTGQVIAVDGHTENPDPKV